MLITRVCTTCKVEKGAALFDKNARMRDGLFTQCKACRHARRMAARRVKRATAGGGEYAERPYIHTETTRETELRMYMRGLRWRDLGGMQLSLARSPLPVRNEVIENG